MRDTGIPTNVKSDGGTPVYLADDACTSCGCYQAYVFECNCGAVHADVCYNCGGFVDMKHEPIEQCNEGLDMWWSGRCTAGHTEHEHKHPFKDFPNA